MRVWLSTAIVTFMLFCMYSTVLRVDDLQHRINTLHGNWDVLNECLDKCEDEIGKALMIARWAADNVAKIKYEQSEES